MGDKQGHPFRGNQWTGQGFPADDAVRRGDMNPEGAVRRVIDEQPVLDDATMADLYGYIAKGDDREINTALRQHPKFYEKELRGEGVLDPEDHPLLEQMSRIQNAALESLAEPVIVYRATTLPPKAVAKLDTPGARLKLGGFHSTSVDANTATGFGGTHLLEIKANQGVYLKESAEQELLLPHGAKFRVIGKKTVRVFANPGRVYNAEKEMTVIQLEQVMI